MIKFTFIYLKRFLKQKEHSVKPMHQNLIIVKSVLCIKIKGQYSIKNLERQKINI